MKSKKNNDLNLSNEPDANRDPISGAPGAHPVGVGTGAAAGGVTGAAIGAIGGPIGAGIGAAVGAVAGGLVGKGVAEGVNPTAEDEYWRNNFQTRDYVDRNGRYEDYQPAYQAGWETYASARDRARSFDEVEPDLSRQWQQRRGSSSLGWDKARLAARDAWDRIECAMPGDFDRDGR
jgi:hypothetical protein